MTENELRLAIGNYVAGGTNIAALEETVAVGGWDARPGSVSAGLSAAVSAVVAELDRGDITEADARLKLEHFATPWVAESESRTETAAETVVMQLQATGRAVVGTPHAMASA